MKRLTLTLAALFLLASCSDQPTTPQASTEAVPAPSFDFSNGPAEPGHSYVVRGAYGAFAYYLIDPVTELAALITDDDPCIDFGAVTLIPVQNIFSPAGESLRLYFEGGWVNAAIFEAYVERSLVPALRRGDVVVFDEQHLRAAGTLPMLDNRRCKSCAAERANGKHQGRLDYFSEHGNSLPHVWVCRSTAADQALQP